MITDILKIAFYCGFLSAGIAILRGAKIKLVTYIYPAAFCVAFVFNYLHLSGHTLVAGISGGFLAAVLMGISHRMGKHGYLFIVIPVIYCIGPGASFYKVFLGLMTQDWPLVSYHFTYMLKVAFGITGGIFAGTSVMNKITGKKSEEF
ncbi:MAG: hypothetical protein IKU54_04330 [Oscillospiraceae bacterium]|nr:hypothetical protein [Oscillospiraceae bacterium]